MQKLLPFIHDSKMLITSQLQWSKSIRLGLLVGLLLFCMSSAIAQETRTVTIQANDTLSEIVAQAYPNLTDRRAIMRKILEENPDAFINNNINQLIIGRTLNLPDTTPDSSSATTEAATNEVTQQQFEQSQRLLEQLETIQQRNRELSDKLDALEQQNSQKDQALEESVQRIEQLQKQLQEEKSTEPADTVPETNAPEATQQLQQELEQLRTDKQQQASRQENLLAELDELKKNQQTLRAENTELEQQLADTKKNLETLEAEKQTLQQELDTLKQQAAEPNNLQQWLADLENRSGLWPWLAVLGFLLLLPLAWWLGRRNSANQTTTTLSPATLSPAAPATTTSDAGLIAPATPSGNENLSNDTLESAVKAADASTTVVKTLLPNEQIAPMTQEDPESSLKLAIAHAYLDLREPGSARNILEDVLTHGNAQQRQKAREILSFIS